MSEILLFEILNHILCNFFLIVKNVFLRFFLFFCHISIYIENTRQLQLHVTGSIASLVALVLRQNVQTSVIFSIIAITRYATNKYGRALSSSMSLCWKLREKSSSYVGPPQYLLFYSLFIKALYMGRSTTNRRGWKPHVFFSFKYVMDGYKKKWPVTIVRFFFKISLAVMVEIEKAGSENSPRSGERAKVLSSNRFSELKIICSINEK